MIARRLPVLLAPLLVAACDDSPGPTAQSTTSVDLGVTNALDVPVRLAVDGTVIGNVAPVSSGRVVVPAGTRRSRGRPAHVRAEHGRHRAAVPQLLTRRARGGRA
jgi:hypothetical protein